MNTQQTGAVSQIKDFFFEAALATYAGGEKAKTNPNDGSKFYSFQCRDYIYLDRFMVNGEYSGGQTVISFQAKPVWLMQYQGWCKNDDREVLAFLKEVLRVSYEKKQFFGGRGAGDVSYRDGSLPSDPKRRNFFYRNQEYGMGAGIQHEPFEKFIGHEQIEELTEEAKFERIFWHRYQGMLLIPMDQGGSHDAQ